MLASIRRFSKSKVGSIALIGFVLLIALSFAAGDVQNVLSGKGAGSSGTLVEVGSEEITERDMSRALEQRLQQARQQDPEADYASLAGEYGSILNSLIDERALSAFAAKYGFDISPRLVGAEIAKIPGARGLDGRFSQQAYQAFLAQQRLTDQEVRNLIRTMLLQRSLLAPMSSAPRIPVGVATPYASMLLETREGEVAYIPAAAFRSGLNPSDAQLQQFYAQNRSRYTVPEQRVLKVARIGPDQVSAVAATDQEIANYYRANQAAYAARDVRTLSQAVAPDRATAEAIATRARAGGSFAAAAAPAGYSAGDVAVGKQTRQQFSSLAGEAVAAAAFGADSGAVVGPVQSDLGWHVVKVEAVEREGGRSLAEARGEIADRLNSEKRKQAIEDLVDRVQDAIDDGANFDEAAAAARLNVTQTPLITATGTARGDAAYRLPEELSAVLRTGFELAPNDEPVIDTLPEDAGYALVAPANIVPAAPAPLASIRDQVRADWINQQALQRARATADAIAQKVAANTPMGQAVSQAGVSLPAVQPVRSRRLDISRMGQVPAPVQMLFNLGEGKSRLVADPQGSGFFVVKANRIIPGNAISQPALISSVQRDFQQPLSQEYIEQFMAAIREEVGVSRNEEAIGAARNRLTAGGQ